MITHHLRSRHAFGNVSERAAAAKQELEDNGYLVHLKTPMVSCVETQTDPSTSLSITGYMMWTWTRPTHRLDLLAEKNIT